MISNVDYSKLQLLSDSKNTFRDHEIICIEFAHGLVWQIQNRHVELGKRHMPLHQIKYISRGNIVHKNSKKIKSL